MIGTISHHIGTVLRLKRKSTHAKMSMLKTLSRDSRLADTILPMVFFVAKIP